MWAGSHTPALVRQGTELVRERRLLPWAFGLANHAIWATSFAALMVVLYVQFAARSYQLTWETTILSQQALTDFIRATGRPAALLGLPQSELRPLAPGDVLLNRQLAFWLIYCVLLYGLVPRLLLALWCRWKWARAREEFSIDFADPYFRRHFQRLDQLTEPEIVDGDHLPARASPLPAAAQPTASVGPPVWIAFELPPEIQWTGDDGITVMTVTGDSEGRQRVVDRLARTRAARAVIVCNGASSPDRGTARFLRDIAAQSGATALLLVAPGSDMSLRTALWTAWLRDVGSGAMPVFADIAAARNWQAAT
jgi:hypothetical protein